MPRLARLYQPVQAQEERLDRHIGHLNFMLARGQLAQWAAWQRVRDTALACGYSLDEAEQQADRIVFEGEEPL